MYMYMYMYMKNHMWSDVNTGQYMYMYMYTVRGKPWTCIYMYTVRGKQLINLLNEIFSPPKKLFEFSAVGKSSPSNTNVLLQAKILYLMSNSEDGRKNGCHDMLRENE